MHIHPILNPYLYTTLGGDFVSVSEFRSPSCDYMKSHASVPGDIIRLGILQLWCMTVFRGPYLPTHCVIGFTKKMVWA